MVLVLIAGKARSGKTQISKMLKQKLQKKGKKVAITEYSKYIKLFAKELTSWDGITEPKPREFLQNFGSYIRKKSKNPHYFIERMKEDISIYQEFLDVLIISDIRLKEEIECLQYLDPITIHVKNDTNPYDLTAQESAHETEHALDNYKNFEYSICNKNMSEIEDIIDTIIENRIERSEKK